MLTSQLPRLPRLLARHSAAASLLTERLDALATHLAASEEAGAGIVSSSSSAASRGATGLTAPAVVAVAAASLVAVNRGCQGVVEIRQWCRVAAGS